MSASGSDDAVTGAPEQAPFVEDDRKRTRLPFDNGRVPFYIAILWVGFIVAYVTVMSLLALPDLRHWMAR